MRDPSSRAVVPLMLVTLVALASCGGKIAPEGGEGGRGGGGAGSSGAGREPGSGPAPSPAPSPPSSSPAVPSPSAPQRPGVTCPASPPGEGDDCGWQYGIPCDYAVSRTANSCAVQCICVGKSQNENRWTCFDLGCDDG